MTLDDTGPSAGPSAPELPATEDATIEMAPSVLPSALDDRYYLPEPLHDRDAPSTCTPAPLLVDSVVADEVALAIQTASEGVPAPAATSGAVVPPDAGVDIPAWLVELVAGRQPSDSSDYDVAFAPVTEPTAPGPTQPAAARPILLPRNLMMIACSAYGYGQAGRLVPALLSGFQTDISYSEILDRLRLLWLMRKDVATQVWAIIILGQARRTPPEAVLIELLGLAQQFMTYTN